MAPSTAERARSTRANPQTPAPVVPRIIPAVPLSFERKSKKPQPESRAAASADQLASTIAAAPNPQPERVPDRAAATDNPPPLANGNQPHAETDIIMNTSAVGPSPADAAGTTSDAAAVHAPPAAKIGVLSSFTLSASFSRSLINSKADKTAAPVPESHHEQSQEPGQAGSREPQHHQQSGPQPRQQRQPFELPPPFYPSTDRSTPTSTTSSTFTRPQPPANPPIMHNPRPSANGIVFGGYPDSSSVSPAPPVTNGNFPYPPPPGAYPASTMVAPPYPFPAHAHHFSEPHTAMMPAAVAPNGVGNFGWRRVDQPLPLHLRQGHSTPNPSVTNSGFSPIHPSAGYGQSFSPVHINGFHPLSRSDSQASSPRIPVTDDTPSEVPVEDASRKRFVHPIQNGVHSRKAPAPAPAPVFPPTYPQGAAEFGLRAYMRSQFSSRVYADSVLKLYPGGGREVILCLPVHSVILGRNRKFADIISKSPPFHSESGLRVLNVLAEDRFLDGPIFAEALKYLYSEDMLSPMDFLQGLAPFTGNVTEAHGYGSPAQRMSHALAYAAAGFWLELRCIVSRGLEIARELLRWDTVETALGFALDGGLDASWRVDDAAEDSSSDDASSKFDTDFAPSYGSYSTQFLQTINGFLVHNFPDDFELDTSASHLHELPRMPSTEDGRPVSRNPRLSQIRFGEVPVDSRGPSQHTTSILSSILLSLPFPVLKALLEDFALCSRLGKGRVGRLMQVVVAEREGRRRKMGGQADDGAKASTVWCERVEPWPQHGCGQRLARSRQDIDTPASSDNSHGQMH
ncbi:uncharacterized protein BKCO1_2000110 [Diplodia corticola]|uniref:BTB domain-containing protein n=1 Tax=Diplodia corticola TaxID=236234 RepID=A0A1J9S4A4_9PEZI|nr:uncharacterized protein BKCO1_2000110 [Diplodia corticola]OJD39779.1 hypothetical protein BKCO1_2000110 [Diplodia corticola]